MPTTTPSLNPSVMPSVSPSNLPTTVPCNKLKLVTGTVVAPAYLATQANANGVCGSSCATTLGLPESSVCGLADGQMDGPGHGGSIQDSLQTGYDCWIVCDLSTVHYKHPFNSSFLELILKCRRYII